MERALIFDENNPEHWVLLLLQVSGLGATRAHVLLQNRGNAQAIFAASRQDLQDLNLKLSENTHQWLKNPDQNFSPHVLVEGFGMGVCVGKIHEKSGLSQSTISHYLSILQNADLLLATRIGKWTYYKSNKTTIENYLTAIISDI